MVSRNAGQLREVRHIFGSIDGDHIDVSAAVVVPGARRLPLGINWRRSSDGNSDIRLYF